MKNLILIGLLAALVLTAVPSVAQKRSADLEVIIHTPNNFDTFRAEEAIPFNVSVRNNGPDDLVAGDSLYFAVYPGGAVERILLQGKGIPSGESLTFIDIPVSFGGITATQTLDLCVLVVWDPSTQLKTNDGQPISVSYADPDSLNNSPCKRIALKVEPTSLLDELADTNPLLTYPNPVSSQLHIALDLFRTETAHIILADITGRIVAQQTLESKHRSGRQSISWGVEHLANGLYTVTLQMGTDKFRSKVMISH